MKLSKVHPGWEGENKNLSSIIKTEQEKTQTHAWVYLPWAGRKHTGFPGALLVQVIRHYYGEQIGGGVWKRETEWLMYYGERQV